MLSELETLELLEQLKQGVLPDSTGELAKVDAVGHWPILIGGGLCLNLQTVAALELNRQPETVSACATGLNTVHISALSKKYKRIHHLKAGHGGSALVVGYDRHFQAMLALLQATDFTSSAECLSGVDVCTADCKDNTSEREYEFSQAIAASIDPSNSGRSGALSLFTSDVGILRLGGSWRVQLKYGKLQSEFFVGLCESHNDTLGAGLARAPKTFSIDVKVENVSRASGSNALLATLTEPEIIHVEKTERCGSYSVVQPFEEFDLTSSVAQPATQTQSCEDVLFVHRLFQLSVDDLYLLLVEAIGRVATLGFKFEIDASVETVDPRELIQEGGSCRCLSVNGLPIRDASLTVANGKFLLRSCE